METKQAREYLKKCFKPEFYHYINNRLAGDFVVTLAREWKQQEEELRKLKNEDI